MKDQIRQMVTLRLLFAIRILKNLKYPLKGK